MAVEDKGKGFQFPFTYPLKVMGRNTNEFYSVVSAIIERHVVGLDAVTYSSRTSSKEKYLSITATFSAESQAQLSAIYNDLNESGLVLMIL